MDKLLAHIDIAQEDGTTNPAAAHSRVKAKTNGSLVSRSSAGVESALGGSLSVQSSVVQSGTAGVTTLQTIPGLGSISIPPGKTARIHLLGRTAGAALGPTTTEFGLRMQQGSGANGPLVGSVKASNSSTNAASNAHVKAGSVVSVAAGATVDFTVPIANSSTTEVPACASAVITNTSSNAISTVFGLTLVAGNTNLSGTAIFALIS